MPHDACACVSDSFFIHLHLAAASTVHHSVFLGMTYRDAGSHQYLQNAQILAERKFTLIQLILSNAISEIGVSDMNKPAEETHSHV